ncbi:angiopoietin-related protein 7 [Brienomyrus brachyistius]|uniref:angiopoietin-related protein 7 n=1 Tax=Brienomyrus brachyistius TaxID=42636 RepID=UPI0020B39967|nr:angiopoietin-related protein 7 [Brienomyrus brachyistius]
MRQTAVLNMLTLGVMLVLLGQSASAQREPRRRAAPTSKAACCEDVRALKVQLANVSSLLEELWRKQETEARGLTRQMLELDRRSQNQEARVTEAEGKYSEINNRVEIMQLQAAQAVTHTSAEAIYDCASLYTRNYKISGQYKLPADEFMGTPELEVYCDMESNGGGWTVIQRRKVGLTSFDRDWKQYKRGFGAIRGDFWLGNDNIFRLTRQPTVLRIEMEDWEGEVRYAQYQHFTLSNELNSYRLHLAGYSGNAGQDSLRYHNNTNFSAKDKDNDKCVDNCAQLRKGGYWYNCCTDSNLNGVYHRYGEHRTGTDGITWYGWHGPNYSLKRVEMKIRPQNFRP